MDYEVAVQKKQEIVDLVLNRLEGRGIDESPLVVLNRNRNFPNYVEYSISRDGAPRINLAISSDGMQVGIEDINEVFDWSDRQIAEEEDLVAGTLEMVLSSAIEIKRCGSKYRRIRFMDESGRCLQTCKDISGFFVPIACRVHLYAPMLPKGEGMRRATS